jgi:hypothetical protein
MLDEARKLGVEIRARLVLLANDAKAGLGNRLRDANDKAKGDIWKIFGHDGVDDDVTFSRMEDALPGLGEIAKAFLGAEISQKNVWVILGYYFTPRPEFGNRTPHAAWTDPAVREVILRITRNYGKRGDPTR